jgi:hypothetical protein
LGPGERKSKRYTSKRPLIQVSRQDRALRLEKAGVWRLTGTAPDAFFRHADASEGEQPSCNTASLTRPSCTPRPLSRPSRSLRTKLRNQKNQMTHFHPMSPTVLMVLATQIAAKAQVNGKRLICSKMFSPGRPGICQSQSCEWIRSHQTKGPRKDRVSGVHYRRVHMHIIRFILSIADRMRSIYQERCCRI